MCKIKNEGRTEEFEASSPREHSIGECIGRTIIRAPEKLIERKVPIMAIKYYPAPDIQKKGSEIIRKLRMRHIDTKLMLFLRSHGSRSKTGLARSHKVSEKMQAEMGMKARYAVEVISENFDKLSNVQKTKVLIHELLHIPKTFRGEFEGHQHTCHERVEKLYKQMRS